MSTSDKRVVISASPRELATSVAARFLDRVAKWASEPTRTVHVALTGGVSASDVLREIGANPARTAIDWSRVHFWWADERYLPHDAPERNERFADEALFSHIDVPTANRHRVAASDEPGDLDAAAAAYAAELARFGTDEQPWPTFDICFLGVGPDAHIASLFPDRPEIQITDQATAAVRDSPKPPAERVTVTRPVINASKRVWMVLSGPDKASALGLALAGASYQSVPAAGAKGRRRTVLFTDRETAAQVPPELIDDQY